MENNSSEEIIETIVPGVSDEELSKARNEAFASAKQHRWYMQGGWLKCYGCPYPHGTFIGNDYLLKGIDNDGNPVLDKWK